MLLYSSYIAYVIILIGSSIIACLLLFRIWTLRSTPGAYGLVLSVACVAEWSLTYAMEIIRTNMAEKIFWAKMEYIGIPFVAVGIFIFAMHFSGRGAWITYPRLILLLTPALLGFLLALTNESHHQIWTDIRFTNGVPFGPLDVTHGVGLLVLTAYLYILILLATISFLQIAIRGQGLSRYQARIMVAGMFFPWAANIIYIGGFSPFPTIDLTPLALTFANVAISVSFLRYRFMDIQPIAHSSVFNAMKDGVIVLDYKERIMDINPVGTMIFQDTGNMLGQEISSLLPKWSEWKLANPTGEVNQEIALPLGMDKHIFSLRTTSLFDQNRKRNGRVLLISDITELKRAQEQSMEASRLKTQLLASVGHDLRAPLGAIIGYAEMMRDGTLGRVSGEQEKASSEILDSANQLLSFINNLVGQAQIETGKVVLREFPFDVEEIVGPLMSTLNFHAHKKGLLLTQYVEPGLPSKIIGDQFWLRQIVLNLVNNAVKFTEKGSVNVRFLRRGENHWAIQVADTGMGIPVEAQKRVFEAFEQVKNPETIKQSGFGLGLSIVAQLASIMNGTIELESEVNRGSKFTLVLPLKVPASWR
ncbi:MAG TPA: histidine kinase N-terminal 7TM domain-containing protein [Anaerolineales bacterium]|nr:histidine kinase N-terminal 7TM domain-containing protein [Anaerolineales bacterium]